MMGSDVDMGKNHWKKCTNDNGGQQVENGSRRHDVHVAQGFFNELVHKTLSPTFPKYASDSVGQYLFFYVSVIDLR